MGTWGTKKHSNMQDLQQGQGPNPDCCGIAGGPCNKGLLFGLLVVGAVIGLMIWAFLHNPAAGSHVLNTLHGTVPPTCTHIPLDHLHQMVEMAKLPAVPPVGRRLAESDESATELVGNHDS